MRLLGGYARGAPCPVAAARREAPLRGLHALVLRATGRLFGNIAYGP